MTGAPYSVLFLDIDSVCNHSRKAETAYDVEGREGFFVEENVPLCPGNVDALKSLLGRIENPAVVWSTDWRLFDGELWNGWKNPMKWLEARDWLGPLVIGKTPKKMSSDRHEEIMMWLRGERPDVRNFAILDDIEYGMNMFGDHYFRCDHTSGLTQDTADRAAEFLARDAGDMLKFSKHWRSRDED